MTTNLKNTISTDTGSGGYYGGSAKTGGLTGFKPKYTFGVDDGSRAERQAQSLIDANMKSMGVSASNPASARLAATAPATTSHNAAKAADTPVATGGTGGSTSGGTSAPASTGNGTGEVELLERIDPTVDVNYNLINELYAAQLQAALDGVDAQYNPLFGVIDTNRENTEADYYEAVRQATALAAREKQAMNEMFNAAGLNTGTAGQAQLANSAVKQQNINAINIAEAQALAEIEAQRAELESEYQAAISEAVLNNEQARAQALLEAEQAAQAAMAEMAVAQALVDVENLTRQAEAAAANGDFSMYSRLGYEPAQIAEMESAYQANSLLGGSAEQFTQQIRNMIAGWDNSARLAENADTIANAVIDQLAEENANWQAELLAKQIAGTLGTGNSGSSYSGGSSVKQGGITSASQLGRDALNIYNFITSGKVDGYQIQRVMQNYADAGRISAAEEDYLFSVAGV